MRKVEVVSPDPNWRNQFELESKRVAEALGRAVVAIHHIGSTSIPHIYAKPIIDLMAEVEDIAAVDPQKVAMEALGYEAMGEFGIPGRRYFRKDNSKGIRTHHVHVFEAVSAQVERHLAFRDYLTAHPDHAKQYSDLKRQLAQQYPYDIEHYMDGKHNFIEAIDQKAALWRSQNL